MFSKKTAFGITGAAAAALLTLGAATPAMANDWGNDSHGSGHGETTSTSSQSTRSDSTSILRGITASGFNLAPRTDTWTPIVLAPSVHTGDIASGDLNGTSVANGDNVASNDPVASGNDVTAPVASGNDLSAVSGNDLPVLSGNDTSVDGNSAGSGNSLSNDIRNTTGGISSDVRDLVGDLTAAVGVSGR